MSCNTYVESIDVTFKCTKKIFDKILVEIDRIGLFGGKLYCMADFQLHYSMESEAGYLEMLYYEISSDFEADLEKLNKLLHQFDTKLEGCYIKACHNDFYRIEIKDIQESPYMKLESEGVHCFLDYSVSQIRELKRIAKKNFK